MKTRLLIVFAFCTFNLFSQNNLAPNGGFETWTNSATLSNWIIENNVTQNTTYFTEGSKSAQLSIANSTTKPKITAQVPMIAGKTYTVKFKYKYIGSNYGGDHPISLNISQNGSATTLSSSTFATNNNWTVKETTFTPDQNLSYDFSISLFTFDDAAFSVLIDDVQVYTEQYTLIPDVNFESKLIALGIDSGATDGKVLTNNINKLTSLNVFSSSIADLTGIQDFVALQSLDCQKNNLTTLDLSKNEKLTDINCSTNKLTNFINTSNPGLESLYCNSNQLTSLDVTKNASLTNLSFSSNKITTIDISSNNLLMELWCNSNLLSELNITNNPSLTKLNCGKNKLTSLNTAKNINLTDLYCHYNQITNIDVSQNTKLVSFMCHFNELTSIDVSNNPKLDLFDCLNNKITSLDISKNPLITELACENNQLTYLNLKNGANTILNLTYSNFVNNPNLTCIQVDDVAYSNAKWSAKKDATATYSSTCSKLGIEDSVFDKIAIYPNPAKGELHIDNIILEKATIYDALGKLVKTTSFTSGDNNNTIHLTGLSKGIYYIYLKSEGNNTAKKIIVE
ncbi:T9SS type A sorting domain-containing protein [Flavobacterium aestivum]|uniref:T9SS type A sorting domain-containing protein n=1 Tax=Flavobacterium aestivum TaxID=3003257 RepID=UPI00248314F2|nr:T9SS type A sorting domain-containing protein [Flavobacterium aestivum]